MDGCTTDGGCVQMEVDVQHGGGCTTDGGCPDCGTMEVVQTSTDGGCPDCAAIINRIRGRM